MGDQISYVQRKYQCMASAATGKGCISSLAIKGNLVFAAPSHTASIFIFDSAADAFVRVAEIDCEAPVKVLLCVDSTRLFTGHRDGKLRVWTHHSHGRRLKLAITLPTLKDCTRNLMKPGSFVQIRRHCKRLWMKHADAVTCLAFSCSEDEEELIYSGSWDKTVKVWRLSDLRCVESICAHDDAVSAIACAGNRGILFTGSADGTVRVWRRRNTGLRNIKHDHVTTLVKSESGAVNCLEMSPDESMLYSGTSDGRIHCSNIDYNSVEICSKGVLVSAQKRSVLCLTTLKQFVCSGSADGTIRVWRRGDKHRCMAVIEGHRAPVKCITAASPSSSTSSSSSNYHLTGNGFVVYSGSMDGTLKMWWVNGNDNDCESDW